MKTIHEIKQEFSSTGAGILNSYNDTLDEVLTVVGVSKPQGPQGVRSHSASSFACSRHAFMKVVSYVLRSADFPGFVT